MAQLKMGVIVKAIPWSNPKKRKEKIKKVNLIVIYVLRLRF